MGMTTGKRKFNNKQFDFYMFADTRQQADTIIKALRKRIIIPSINKLLARVTKEKNPWHIHRTPTRARNVYRYRVWVQMELNLKEVSYRLNAMGVLKSKRPMRHGQII